MKYTIRSKEKYVVELDRKPALHEEISVKVNKNERQVKILETNSDGSIKSVMIDNRLYKVQVDNRSDGLPQLVSIGGIHFPVEVEKAESIRFKPPRPEKQIKGDVNAELPGQVMKILIEEGQPVKQGQPILILEAMKMENEILSPKDGVLKTLEVKEGSLVMKGDLLLVVE